jgi:hypothetical protein
MTRTEKRIPVTHEKFGAGKISHIDAERGIVRVVFKGRVTRDINIDHVRLVLKPGDVMRAKLSGISVLASVMLRLGVEPRKAPTAPTFTNMEQLLRALYRGEIQLPHDTVTERAHAEFRLGVDTGHIGLQIRSFWSLIKIAMRAGRGLRGSTDEKFEPSGSKIGFRPQPGRAFDKAVHELVKWLTEHYYDPRHFGRHIRFRMIDDLRKERTASHRRQKDRSEMNPDTIVMGRRAGSYDYTKPEMFEMWKDWTPEWHRKERSDKGKKRRPYRSKSSKYRKPLAVK